MIRILVCMCLLGGVVSLSGELSPAVAPSNPLTFQTELGSVPTTKDPLLVRLTGIVTPERTTMQVEVDGRALSLEAALSMASLLDQAIERARGRQEFSSELDGVEVKVKEKKDAYEVRVNLPGDGLFKRAMRMDSDSAFLLSRLMRRAHATAQWLQPRIAPLLDEAEPAL
ncbi:MAG: hypothetical protein ACFB20_08840 [Opitutales bacterium]